jgi:hypothetical protein
VADVPIDHFKLNAFNHSYSPSVLAFSTAASSANFGSANRLFSAGECQRVAEPGLRVFLHDALFQGAPHRNVGPTVCALSFIAGPVCERDLYTRLPNQLINPRSVGIAEQLTSAA